MRWRIGGIVVLAACLCGAAPSQSTGWRTIKPRPGVRVKDLGIGVLTFRTPGEVPADTLTVYPTMSTRSRAIAYLIQRGDGAAWNYRLVTRGDFTPQFFEYGGEQCGVPIDSVLDSGYWARVQYARTQAGRLKLGWVHLARHQNRVVMWPAVLPRHALFFADWVTPEFHGQPGGETRTGILEAGTRDYILHSIRVEGAWMLVRLMAPSDYCQDDGVERGRFWIRYLDERGRPRVWFFTRGC